MKYGGEIAGFPQEVVERMLHEQELQKGKRDVRFFETCSSSGFSWMDTEAGQLFWQNVINEKNFDLFFQRYPKAQPENKYPMLMWVGDTQEEVDEKRYKRVVFMEKCGMFIAWDLAESFDEAEKTISSSEWRLAKPVTEPMTITPQQIREAFNCDEFVISEQ